MWALLACEALGASIEPGQTKGFDVLSPHVYENFTLCAVENGCLTETNTVPISGNDPLGVYDGYLSTYVTSEGTPVETSARSYEDRGITVYKLSFERGLNGTSTGNKDRVCTGYPVFQLPNSTESPALRFVTPGDHMTGWTIYSQGYLWPDHYKFRSGEGGGITGFILTGDGATWSLMMSALSQPMDVNNWLDVNGDVAALHWGVQGLAESIPPAYEYEVIEVTDSTTFTANVLKWGAALQEYHGTVKVEDDSTDVLGYWTDNGAYHYYNPAPFDDYEQLIVDLYDKTTERGIPFNYLQLDSWWYYKGVGGGLKNWTARPDVFPNGIEAVHEYTGWPILAHNRYFSSDTDYAIQNGGDFPFVIDETTGKALPVGQDFWEYLFGEALPWGLAVYEQDWLDREYEEVSLLHADVYLGSAWLNNMAAAAKNKGLPIQYCMALTRHMLHAASLDSVTQIRVSEDYMLAPNQWSIGHTSLFAHALGMKPYKDLFWTNRTNPNNPYSYCEFFSPTDPGDPVNLLSNYVGWQNVTASGVPCLPWKKMDFHGRYPHDTLYENFCRNPDHMKERAFCYTSASLDTPEESWEWEYCDPPVCEIDCFVKFGYYYIGNQSVTENGFDCVDWNGEFGLEGKKCRNPTMDEDRPWCYVTEDHSRRDFCDNQCAEAEEPNPELQSAVATLSTGPVGIGDSEENIVKDLVLRSCRSDGRILKPQKPLTAIDLFFILDEQPNIWTADVTINFFTFGIIFLAEVEDAWNLYPFQLNLDQAFSSDVVLWQNYPPSDDVKILTFGTSVPLPQCGGYMKFCLLYTSPVLAVGDNRVAILGEKSKWAPIAKDRIRNLTIVNLVALLEVEGVVDEQVVMSFWTDVDGDFEITCHFTVSGLMAIDILAKTCS